MAYMTYLHTIGHSPPLPHFRVRPHALHVPLEVCADVLHSRK